MAADSEGRRGPTAPTATPNLGRSACHAPIALRHRPERRTPPGEDLIFDALRGAFVLDPDHHQSLERLAAGPELCQADHLRVAAWRAGPWSRPISA